MSLHAARPSAIGLVALALVLSVPAAPSAYAAPHVTGLAAACRRGQTFLTWTPPAGTGWTFRVYAASAPIASADDLESAEFLGAVGDSSACDRRLGARLNATFGHRPDSVGAELDPASGLFVALAEADRPRWYAVTTEAPGAMEAESLVLGESALFAPVGESVGDPEPVWQRRLTWGGRPFDVYTLWTSDRATPRFPAMANVPGLAFDCAIGAPRDEGKRPLWICPHAKGGHFLDACWSVRPGEWDWQLALDDGLPNGANTYYLGYHEQYDVRAGWWSQPERTTGQVQPYTERRVLHTIGWARRRFPVDTTNVHAFGISMGGIASLHLAAVRPDWLASVFAIVPKVEFASGNDPEPLAQFNDGQFLRLEVDRLWSRIAADLPCGAYDHVFEYTSIAHAAAERERDGLPPIVLFSGKRDEIIGWGEKPPFYAAMESARQGGAYFWDGRDHIGISTAYYSPAQDPARVLEWRTNVSWPAFSRASDDGDPGWGAAADGDSVGSIHGALEWDPPVDVASTWSVRLRTRALATRDGLLPAPSLVTADVTPRRLQRFKIVPNALFSCAVIGAGGESLWQGHIASDALGLLTVPAVPITPAGVDLRIAHFGSLDAGGEGAPPTGARLAIAGTPGARIRALTARGFASAPRLVVLDAAGRIVSAPIAAAFGAGEWRAALEASALAPGLYFVRATDGVASASGRFVVLR